MANENIFNNGVEGLKFKCNYIIMAENLSFPKSNFGLSGLAGGLSLVNAYLRSQEKKPRFEIYTDSKEPVNKFRWHIEMSSDIVAASSQGYATRQLCLENVKSILKHLLELDKENKLI